MTGTGAATAATAPTCVFCAITTGGAEADLVLDEEHFVAFLDRRPLFKGHVLLVPRRHVVTLPDLPAGLRDGSSRRPSGSRPPWSRRWVLRGASWR